MNGDPLNCPFCNARQPYRPELVAGSRLVCVRCAESFTLTQTPEPPSGSESEDASPVAPSPQRSNRLVASVVIAGMIVMAAIALVYALVTVAYRRGVDQGLTQGPRSSRSFQPLEAPEEATSPLTWTALRYLPAQTNVVVAASLNELLNDPSLAAYRNRPFKMGELDLSPGTVAEWIGLPAAEVEQVVLGAVLRQGAERELTPPVHLVVRTRKPYDASRVRTAVKGQTASPEPTLDGKTRSVMSCSVRGFPARLWVADERTLVFGWFTRLELLPSQPYPDSSHLPGAIKQLLETRLSAGVPLWVVGHSSDWSKTVLPLLLANVPGVPLLAKLDRVQGFTLALQPGERLRLQGAFQCVNTAAAMALVKEELAELAGKEPDRFKYSQEAEWLTIQLGLSGP